MRTAAIEGASVEMIRLFERVSSESKIENNAVAPINKLVYYWTRKRLVVGRAVALACTLENPKDVESLLGLHTDKRAYKSVPDLKKYERLLGVSPSNISYLDPFAGTGALAFPSAELGLDVTVSDYNPLAHLIERGSLSIPASSGIGIAQKFEDAANHIIADTERYVGQFYKSHVLAYLWVWCIRCVHCGQRIPLLNQMYLSKKKKIGLKITPTKNKDFVVEIDRNISPTNGKKFTQKRGKVQCISCGNTISGDDMRSDITEYKDRQMIAIQIQRPNRQGRDYVLPSKDDKEQYQKASSHTKYDTESVPVEEILASHRKQNTLWLYGITHWNEFYSDRQLLVLSTLVKTVRSYCNDSTDPDIPAIRVYLAFLVAQFVNVYSYGVVWNTSRDTPEHTLTLRRPSIVFNMAEINPFVKVRGSLRNCTSNIKKSIEFCARIKTPANCKLESVTKPPTQQYDLIITDPPYGDDVQYGELSEFLYLWAYRVLQNDTLPARAPLDEDFCESQGRFGDKKLASEFFELGLKKSFESINHKLKDDGLMAVFFAHSSIQAWNQLLLSLRAGGFRVVSSYAIHTESASNPIARNKASLMSSIIVACRKITGKSSGFIEDIIPDMEDRISDVLETIPNDKLLTLPITDLMVMVYGKVLEACTRYSTLKSRSGDSEPDFEALLSHSQLVIMQILVRRLTKTGMNTVGPRMAFYVFAKVFNGGKVSADEMLKITKAYNIEPRVLVDSGVVIKDGNTYRTTYLHKNEMDFAPEDVARDNLHQQLCYLARRVDTNEAKAIDDILNRDNFMNTTLKQIVYLFIQSNKMRKNRGESIDKNDRDEMKILKTLADIMGVRIEGGLDAFVSK